MSVKRSRQLGDSHAKSPRAFELKSFEFGTHSFAQASARKQGGRKINY